MKTNMNICKLGLLLLLCLGQSALAMADTRLFIEDFSIASGETKELSLMLSNDQEATALQADIVLPTGLSYVEGSVAKTERVKGRGATVQASTEKGYLVIVATGGTIAAGEGAIITFQVKAGALTVDNHKIGLKNIVVSDAEANQLNSEETNTCNVEALGMPKCTFAAATPSIELLVGDEALIDITLANDGVTNLSAFQGILALPAGLELVPGEDGKFIYSERTPAPMEFKFKEEDGKLNFLISSQNNTLITGTEGIIFSFKVKATDALAESSEIVLSNLRVAATTGQSATCDDVTISVTRGIDYEALALEEAQEQLNDLKAKAGELAVSDEAQASNNATVAAAVKTAEEAIEAANAAIDDVQAVIDKGELATTNKKELEDAITAANTAIADANTAIAAAETALKEAETPVADVPGDLGGDGEVDDGDVDTLINALLEGTCPTDKSDPMFRIYDVNDDGYIDIADAQAAFNLSMGLNANGTQK